MNVETIAQNDHEFIILREVRQLSRREEKSIDDVAFHENHEPGTWEMKFKITALNKRLQIFFGRKKRPTQTEGQDELGYKCISDCKDCTSIQFDTNNPNEPNVKILVINYTIQNKQFKYNVPFVMNKDPNLWPWSHWDHHFEMKNVSNGVSWVNKILQNLQTRDIDTSVRHQKTQVDVCSGNPYLIVKKS
jgi:hypothetical protein